MTKIVVIGKGEFGNSLTQGLETATIPFTNATVFVEQVSVASFFSMSVEEMSEVLTNASYVMYCGRKLSENADLLASALQGARNISIGKGPLLELIDWSNPDPQTESYDGAVAVAAAVSTTPDQVVWKVTGLSSYDVSGHTVSIKRCSYIKIKERSICPHVPIPTKIVSIVHYADKNRESKMQPCTHPQWYLHSLHLIFQVSFGSQLQRTHSQLKLPIAS